ncbi:mediator of RNA polymerase II transcription subunit 8 [Sporothrix curviconia]|uniref:Mediator of RNA polymerase II transcription subunit 8 n=1 Tax=Sporothrix curviconia TaxID=1260050 RepID=A0ABP0B9F3_9PEZI
MDSDDTALGLTQEDLRAIDTVRARLYQLANSVQRLKGDVMMSNLLPSPESIQASSFVLQQNLASLNEVMAQHADLFRRIVVHPDPMYPGRTEEQILTSLLRKKLEPDVEQVAERARETAAARGIGKQSFAESLGGQKGRRNGGQQGGGGGDDDDDDDDEDEDDEDDEDEDEEDEEDENGDSENFNGPREPFGLGDVWHEARAWTMGRLEQFIREEAPDMYTKEERERGVENVRTGLRRSLEDDEDDEDDDDDDDDDDDAEDETGGSGSNDDVNMLDGAPATSRPSQATQQPSKPPAGPAVEPEVLLWLAARGDTDLPRYVEIESQRAAAAAAAQRRL